VSRFREITVQTPLYLLEFLGTPCSTVRKHAPPDFHKCWGGSGHKHGRIQAVPAPPIGSAESSDLVSGKAAYFLLPDLDLMELIIPTSFSVGKDNGFRL
jgi:hypothetical protein